MTLNTEDHAEPVKKAAQFVLPRVSIAFLRFRPCCCAMFVSREPAVPGSIFLYPSALKRKTEKKKEGLRWDQAWPRATPDKSQRTTGRRGKRDESTTALIGCACGIEVNAAPGLRNAYARIIPISRRWPPRRTRFRHNLQDMCLSPGAPATAASISRVRSSRGLA